MKGFIVDETYRIEHGKAYVYLFGRLENGESFCAISYQRPHVFIKQDDLQKAKKVPTTVRFEGEETALRTMREEPMARLVYDIPKDTGDLRKVLEEARIVCYEADIRFTQRFLLDRGVLRSVEIQGGYEKGERVDRVYKEPTLTPADWYPSLRILAFDIETSPDARELYSISLVCEGKANEVLIVSERKYLQRAVAFPNEKSLLMHFMRRVIEIDPDIITGWNTIDFDFVVIRDKCKEHGVPFRFGRWDWECTLRIESSFMRESAADVAGRQALDGIQLLKLNFIALENYKLATAARVLLGQEKLIQEQNKGQDIADAFRDDPQKLVDYNLKDSQLVLDILERTKAVDIMLNRALITGMSLDRVRGSIASFDSLYLRRLREQGYVAPSVGFSGKDEQIGGGFVKESAPGLYEHLVVLDFKSLYPSLMRTFNIDPLAYERGKDAKDTSNKHKWIIAPNGAVFSAEEGILPALLQQLWDARDRAKKRKSTHESQAIKILMNSFFGVLASPLCRFYSLEMANAITAFGRQTIQQTSVKIEEMGYKVIYADTDSAFVDAGCRTYEEAQATAAKITKAINKFYADRIKEEYRRTSYLELEPDKIFVHFLMPKVRSGEQGAKKRYAGTVMEGGKEKLVVTGMEIVRRDWTEIAKEFQERLLTMLFRGEDPGQYIRDLVKDLKDGKLDGKLVYQKAARKELERYTKTTPPHIKAARMLEERGIPLKSNLVEYVITSAGPRPIELLEGSAIDYDHYLEKQLKPIADPLLSLHDQSFDDILRSSKQMTLGGF